LWHFLREKVLTGLIFAVFLLSYPVKEHLHPGAENFLEYLVNGELLIGYWLKGGRATNLLWRELRGWGEDVGR